MTTALDGSAAPTTTDAYPLELDDLLDVSYSLELDDLLDIAPANDVDERRAPLRLLPRWAMRATLAADSPDGVYADLSYDLSRGGIFVATYDTPVVGARIDLTLTFADGRELEVIGLVRWIRDADLESEGLPAGCGIECKGLPLAAQRALEAFAATRTPLLWLPEAA